MSSRITFCYFFFGEVFGALGLKPCYIPVLHFPQQNDSFSNDPFGDMDEDLEVASIAQRFEAKYVSLAGLQNFQMKSDFRFFSCFYLDCDLFLQTF